MHVAQTAGFIFLPAVSTTCRTIGHKLTAATTSQGNRLSSVQMTTLCVRSLFTKFHPALPAIQEIFARRLKAFYEQTSPLLAYYASRAAASTRVVTLKGTTSDEIWPQLEGIIQQSFRLRPKPEPSQRVDLGLPRREEGRRTSTTA